MKKTVRHILALCFLALMAICLTAAYETSAVKRDALKCNGLAIAILDSVENSFVSGAEIRKFLDAESGDILGSRAGDIDLTEIEHIIDGKSAVLKSEAYMTKDGTLHIAVTQRRPAVRFQKQNGGFYADREGFIFPLQDSYTAYVPVIDGNIPVNATDSYKGEAGSEKEKKWIKDMISLVNYMDETGVWAENIVQITVLDNGDLVMIPRKGKEKFLFGSPQDIEDKFSRMEKYYTGILPAKGEGYYSSVNVKYKGQIICRK